VGAGLLVSGICLYLALRSVDIGSTWTALLGADLRWIAAALGFVLINNLAKAARWKVLLGPSGEQVPFGRALVSHLVGQTLNVLFPFRVGDLSRAYTLGGVPPGRAYVLGTVVLEKVPDMIALGSLFLALLFLLPMPGWASSPGYSLLAVALFSLLALMLAGSRREGLARVLDRTASWLPERWQAGVRSSLQSGLSALDVLRSRGQLFRVAFWTALVWLMAVGVNYLVFRALDLQLPLEAAMFLLLVLQVGIVLPSAPGRIGVFEYICVLVLGIYGLESSQALGYGILLHAVVFLPMAVLGLVFWGLLGSNQQGGQQSTTLMNPSEGDPL
jgi:uncharacterized protein (TIRG00374 family)